MKLRLTALTLATGLALTAFAQNPTPPAPPTPAAPPAPGAPGTPGLLPPAQSVPVEEPDGFKTEKERQGYAVGWLFATREKVQSTGNGETAPKSDEVIAGIKDVLANTKSADYAMGAMMALQIRRAGVDVDQETLFAAVRDALGNQTAKLTPQQQQLVLQRVQNDVRTRTEARQKADMEKNLKASTDFLATNSKVEGVKTSPSGLQYVIEKPGEGKSATPTDIVTMNIKGTLTDGSEFENNPPTGPVRKAMRALPKGLQEGLGILKLGGKGKFWVPPAIGFGENGRPPVVKSNAVLVYEVELISVEPLPAPPPAQGGVNPTPGQPPRAPVTAVTPPITVEIPPKPGEKPAEAPKAPTPPPAPPAPPK